MHSQILKGVVDRTSALARVSISRQYTTTLGVVDCMRQADAEGKSVWTWQEIYTVDISGKKNTNSEYDVHGDKKTCRDGDEGEEDDEELEYLGNIRIEANGESMRVRRRETDIHHKGYIQSRVYNSKYDMNLRGEMSTIRFAGIPSHFKSVVNREDPNTISSKHPIHTNRNDDGGKIVDTNMVCTLSCVWVCVYACPYIYLRSVFEALVEFLLMLLLWHAYLFVYYIYLFFFVYT